MIIQGSIAFPLQAPAPCSYSAGQIHGLLQGRPMTSIIPSVDQIAGAKLLIVDDSKLVYKALSRIFSRVGIDTDYAALGQEGYHKATARSEDALTTPSVSPYDAILLDLHLPDTDGLSVCAQLRANPLTQNLPILIITSASDAERHIAALDAGADDFVSKPPNQKVLLRRLATVILQRRNALENQRLLTELESYISSATVDQVQKQKGIETIPAAILFSDMRGFTAASYDNDNEEVFEAINLAMSFQSELVQKHDGYVDGFSGDGMLAVFDGPDCARSACLAAIDIIKKARETSVRIWDPLPIGIGLNYGHVIRGDLGSESRRAHTVIGNAVNVSARLCGVAKGREAVASQSIVQQVQDLCEFSEPQAVDLKGIPEPFYAYSLIF